MVCRCSLISVSQPVKRLGSLFFFLRGQIGSGFRFEGNYKFMQGKGETRLTSVHPNWNPTAPSQSWLWKGASTTESCPSVTAVPLGPGVLAWRNWGAEGLSVDAQLKVVEWRPKPKTIQGKHPCPSYTQHCLFQASLLGRALPNLQAFGHFCCFLWHLPLCSNLCHLLKYPYFWHAMQNLWEIPESPDMLMDKWTFIHRGKKWVCDFSIFKTRWFAMPLKTLSKYNQFFPCKELVIFNINTGCVRT